jgi:hypothetical protein
MATAMSALPNPKPAIQTELRRIEEDCTYSGKAHFNAGVRWSGYHNLLGIPSVILSALAGAAFFKNHGDIAGVMSSIVAIMTSLMTFLKPSERAAAHKGSGDQYISLRNDARVFREIHLASACDDQAAMSGLGEFTKRRNELNQASMQVSKADFARARQGIEEGEALHVADKKGP